MIRIAGSLVLSFVVAAQAFAQVRTPAELFPPALDFHIETAEPKLVVAIVEEVIRGTPWEDALTALHDRLDGKGIDEKGLWKGDPLPELTLLTAPEARTEFRKLGGCGFAYLGLNEKRQPRWAGVLLTGECKVVELAMRAWLTLTDGGWRRVGMLEKTAMIFQRRLPDPNFRKGNAKGPEEAWAPGTNEPTLVMLPGLIVVASDVAAATDVVRRFRGADGSPSLATSTDYRERRAARPEGTLLAISAKPAKLLADHAAMRQADPKVLGASFAAYLRFLVGIEQLPEFHAHLTMKRDALELIGSGRLGTSPLRPLFALAAVDPAWGEHLPKEAAVRLALRLPNGPANRTTLGPILNAVAQAQGRLGRKPSLLLADWEKTKAWDVLNDGAGLGLAVTTDARLVWQLHLGVKRPLAERSAEVGTILKQIYRSTAPFGREEDAKQHVFTLGGANRLHIVVTAEKIEVLPTLEPSNEEDERAFATVGTPMVGALTLHQLVDARRTLFFGEAVQPKSRNGNQPPPVRDDPSDPLTPLSLVLRDVVPTVEVRISLVGNELTVRLTIPKWRATLLRFFEAQSAKDDPDAEKPKGKEVPAERKEPVAAPPPPK